MASTSDIGIRISAVDDTQGALASVKSNLESVKTSAASVAGALASIGVGVSVGAFVAMTKQIIDGIDAMNDLKDATGASIENISALENVALRTGSSFETVSTALIKFNKALSTAKPGSDTEQAITAIGLSVKNLKELDPAVALQQVASGLAGYADDANKARLVQELFGKSLKEVAPLLKDLAESGQLVATVTTAQAEEAEKLNKQLFTMQANSLELKRAFVNELIPSLSALAAEMLAAKKTSIGFWDGFITQGLQNPFESVAENAASVRKDLAGLEADKERFQKGGNDTSALDTSIATLKRRLEYFKEVQLQTMQYSKSDQSSAEDARLGLRLKTVGDVTGGKPVGPARTPKETGNAFAGEQEAAKEWAKALEAAGKASDELIAKNMDLSKSQAALEVYLKSTAAAINEKTNPAMNDMVRAAYEANIALETMGKLADVIEAQQKRTSTAQDETAKERDRVAAIGLTTEAVAELGAARLEEMAIAKERSLLAADEIDLSGTYSESIKAEVAALRERAGLLRTGAAKEAALDAAKAANDEWKRGWEETDRISRDVFTAWATEGGSAAKIIGDTLKKALLSAIYEATLKPLVFQVYASLTGGGGASAALQAASGVGSTASGIENLFGIGGAGGYASQFASGFSGSASAASAMMGGAELTTAAQMGSMAAAVAPYLLGAIALKALTDYKVTPTGSGITATLGSGGVSSGSVSSYRQFEQQGGLFGGGTTTNRDWSMADAGTTQYINEATKAGTAAIKAYAAAIGLSSTSIDSFTKSIDVSLAGLDPEQAKAAINKAIGGFFDDMVSSAYADIASLSKPGEAASATLQRVATDFVAVTHSLDMLGFAALKAGADSAKAAASIIDSFGGLDKFNASVGYFYEHFFSEGERAAKNQESTKAEFAKLNLDMPTSKEAYRKLVEDTIKATDANSESSRKFLADLLSLAPAFDSVANSAANAATAATAAAAAHQQAVNAALANYGTPEEQKANALKQIQAGLASGGVNLSIEQISKASRADARALWEQYMALAAQGNKDAQAAADAILAQQDAFAKITDAYNQGGMTGGATGGTDPGGDRGVWGTNASITYDYADSVPGGSGGATSASKAWKEATDAIKATMADLRKTLIENGPDSFARIQAQFAIELAQARAGDAKAAKDLPDLAKQMIAAQKGNSASALDEALFKARLVEQLGSVVGEDPATEAAKAALRAARDAANVAALAAEELINAAIDRANSLAETKAGEVSGGRLTHLYDGPVKYWRDYQTDSPFGIPSYDVGTNYVPKDMIAQIHKGEVIIPAAYNPMANPGANSGNGYAELVAEVRALRAEVAAQRPALDATASNTGKAAKVLDAAASGGQPLGMEIV